MSHDHLSSGYGALNAGPDADPPAGGQRTSAFLSLALGLLGALGGGVLGTATQWLFFTNDSAFGGVPEAYAVVSGAVPALFGVVAVVLGLRARGSDDALDAPLGTVGAVLGIVAVVGGVVQAIALLQQ